MLNYKHILIATDLSDDFAIVADTALSMAKRSNSKLSMIHVIEHTPVVYGGGEFSIPLDMNLEEHLTQNVRKALEEVGSRYGINLDNQFVGHGSVKKEVLDLAKQLDVDLIVVGSHGHSGMEILLGSVANAILHSAKCDVLAVRIKSE
jgi:universal stress protein A